MMIGKYEVTLVNDESTQEFDVLFEGPADSHYEGVSIILSVTDQYNHHDTTTNQFSIH